VRGVRAVDARRLRRQRGRQPLEELEEGRRVVQQEPREDAEGGCGPQPHTKMSVADLTVIVCSQLWRMQQ